MTFRGSPAPLRAASFLAAVAGVLVTQAPGLGDGDEPTYVGSKTCKKCHLKQYKSWEQTKMAKTFDTLKANESTDKKARRRAAKLVGVGCEACHGPGSRYVELHKEIQDQGRKYRSAEMHAAGMFKIGPEVCAACHNTESPFVDDNYVFDYEKRKDEGTHEHFELRLRIE